MTIDVELKILDPRLGDSILLPQSQIAAGYPNIMPTYQNVLGEDDVEET